MLSGISTTYSVMLYLHMSPTLEQTVAALTAHGHGERRTQEEELVRAEDSCVVWKAEPMEMWGTAFL